MQQLTHNPFTALREQLETGQIKMFYRVPYYDRVGRLWVVENKDKKTKHFFDNQTEAEDFYEQQA